MSRRQLLLAIDIGTSGVKVGMFDMQGRIAAKAVASYATSTPRPGWVEQDPAAWWQACCKAIKEAASLIDPSDIQGLCVIGLSPAMVCVDAKGEVVCPAPIWSDQRAADEIAELSQKIGPHIAFTYLPRLLWLARHEGEAYRRTRWAFEPFDYINFKLTGEAVCVPQAGASLPWTAQDIVDLGLEPEKIPSPVCSLGKITGRLRADVAAALGLPTGLPAVAGTIDAFAAWVGTATIDPGVMCNTAGTTDGVAVICERRLDDPLNRVQSMPHIVERHGARNWIVGGAMSSGGIMLDWFVRRFYAHLADPYLVVSDEAARVPVGAEGLIVLPYLLGERSPINDPDARSVFFGISETHTRAHMARAVLESVAFAVRDVCEAITEVGAEIAEVRIAGGASRSDVWNQIKADVLGRSVLVPSVADSGMLGAAIIAGWGIGCFADLADAAQTMVKFRAKVEPNQDHHAVYSRLFNFYRGLYARLKSDFAERAQMRRAH